MIGQFQLMDFPLVAAPDDLLEMHRRVLSRVIARNHHTRERFLNDLVELLPDNIDAIAIHLENCGECRECLDKCPQKIAIPDWLPQVHGVLGEGKDFAAV